MQRFDSLANSDAEKVWAGRSMEGEDGWASWISMTIWWTSGFDGQAWSCDSCGRKILDTTVSGRSDWTELSAGTREEKDVKQTNEKCINKSSVSRWVDYRKYYMHAPVVQRFEIFMDYNILKFLYPWLLQASIFLVGWHFLTRDLPKWDWNVPLCLLHLTGDSYHWTTWKPRKRILAFNWNWPSWAGEKNMKH